MGRVDLNTCRCTSLRRYLADPEVAWSRALRIKGAGDLRPNIAGSSTAVTAVDTELTWSDLDRRAVAEQQELDIRVAFKRDIATRQDHRRAVVAAHGVDRNANVIGHDAAQRVAQMAERQ